MRLETHIISSTSCPPNRHINAMEANGWKFVSCSLTIAAYPHREGWAQKFEREYLVVMQREVPPPMLAGFFAIGAKAEYSGAPIVRTDTGWILESTGQAIDIATDRLLQPRLD